MGRLLTSRFFPAIAAAFAAAVGFGVWFGADALADSVAIGLGAFAALVAVRNWTVAEEDRPLLADELIGVHETLDGLREEAVEIRAMMSELTVIVEDALIDVGDPNRAAAAATAGREIAALADETTRKLKALEQRLDHVEAARSTRNAAPPPASPSSIENGSEGALAAAALLETAARLEAVEERLDAHDRRTSMLARALKLTVAETRDVDARLRRLKSDVDGGDDFDPDPDVAEAVEARLIADAEAGAEASNREAATEDERADASVDAIGDRDDAMFDPPTPEDPNSPEAGTGDPEVVGAALDEDDPEAAGGSRSRPSTVRLAEERAAAEAVKARRLAVARNSLERPKTQRATRSGGRRSSDRSRAEAVGAAVTARRTSSEPLLEPGLEPGLEPADAIAPRREVEDAPPRGTSSTADTAGFDVAHALAAQARRHENRPRAGDPEASVGDAQRPEKRAVAGDAPPDAALQPIAALPSREPAFFEAFLPTATAEPRETGQPPRGEDDAGDGAAFFRDTARIVEHLTRAGSNAGVLRQAPLAMLRGDAFLDALDAGLAADRSLSARLLFELDQRAVRAATAEDHAALTRIKEAGFRFALGSVSDWSVAPEHLARLGVGYVKLPASELTPTLGETSAAKRRLDRLRRLGLELIAERVDDEAQIAELSDAGVGFGQGRAIGPQRLVRLA